MSGLFLCVYEIFFFGLVVESGFCFLTAILFLSVSFFVGLYERGWKERGFEY